MNTAAVKDIELAQRKKKSVFCMSIQLRVSEA
jgi:hypothetical protein